MPIRISGATSGYTELAAPAAAGNNTISFPSGNGTNGQVLSGNGSGALSWSNTVGSGQTWTNVLASRATGTTYTNSTGAPIFVVVSPNASANLVGTFNINGTAVGGVQFTPSGGGGGSPFFYVIPNGATYSVTNNSNYGLAYWWELR
jgi:hypothetical protein